jgi:hypothetical protein
MCLTFLVPQLYQSLPALLDALVRAGPVDLVQVYDVRLQAPEATLALALHGVLLQHVVDLAVLVPDERALGEDVGAVGLRDPLQGLRDELLGVA